MAIWRPIPGFPELEASSVGQIRTIDRVIIRQRADGPKQYSMKGKILKPILSGGYWTVTVKTDKYVGRTQRPESISRLVCLAFHGKPPKDKPFACHRDDDRSNNRKSNLYWGDYTDNMIDAQNNGRNHGIARRLSKDDEDKMISIYNKGKYSQAKIASKFGISQARLSQIIKERSTGKKAHYA